ncbi:MAG: cryptochrome/photolyase family protein [Proteobacteria bacterium SW_6_67_9]|nr:MAG: cryptochrome/photolyase family protein [Proteobacteria bacterium SW_6_67_9]
MSVLNLVLGDQLTPSIAALRTGSPDSDVVLLAEVAEEATYVAHHPQKIALVFAAMRHFAAELRGQGWTVDYAALDDAGNTGSLAGEAARAAARWGLARLRVTEPGEWRLARVQLSDPEGLDEAAAWDFYRGMRRRHGVLVDGDGQPAGGAWNYDTANRKALPRGGLDIPAPPHFPPDATTRAVLALVAERFGGHFGSLDNFGWAVTRADAERARDHFLTYGLPLFGDYQDAMRTGEPWLFHSVLSPYLNMGLLDPRDLIERAQAAWHDGAAPLNAVEGFIRQILGWREYVRGIYWRYMPDYAERNALDHQRRLPWLYWSGDTHMRCLREAITGTRDNAYAHHIQRLMVTGNFALLAGVDPAAVCEWYLVVYADAYEWVELPNTLGMALYGDGGLLGSKPYAASGQYIRRMSDYCRHCPYDVNKATGDDACPFNALYWHFLMRQRPNLGANHRLRMPYRNLDRMDDARRDMLWRQGEACLARVERDDPI